MDLQGLNVGICMCGSFCTFKNIIEQIKLLKDMGMNLTPIMSYNAASTNTRFGTAEYFIKELEDITGKNVIRTIEDAEPIGPQNKLDIMIAAPCTGNTLAKLNHGITDTPVLMACKAHLRNNKPLLIALATNDALGSNFENIGGLFNKKNIYFVPFGQDDCIKKPRSMVAKFDLIVPSIEKALEGIQIQPVIV